MDFVSGRLIFVQGLKNGCRCFKQRESDLGGGGAFFEHFLRYHKELLGFLRGGGDSPNLP